MKKGKGAPLSAEEEKVIVHRGTEPPFSGRWCNHFADGSYHCRRCGTPLYRSSDKFDAGCGWPAFDDALPGSVRETPDPDGVRTEISCAACGGHLGHVFRGERFTPANTRHCVNSLSLGFSPGAGTERAVFAGGCFWGVEHFFRCAPGVASTRVGYTGGHIENPSYEAVCSGNTGHYEAVEVVFDPGRTTYREMLELFFEQHDFTREDGQGPDIGPQYLSAVFYTSGKQREAAREIIKQLGGMGFRVATAIRAASAFWPAEEYHQRYLEKTGRAYSCRQRRVIFRR